MGCGFGVVVFVVAVPLEEQLILFALFRKPMEDVEQCHVTDKKHKTVKERRGKHFLKMKERTRSVRGL